MTPRILLAGRCFLEGPRWHDGALYVSDMHAHEVLRVDVDGTFDVVLEHDGPVSGLGWLPDGSMLVVAMAGDLLRQDTDGKVTVHADLREIAPHEVNDMVSHPGGWSYVGQFGYDWHHGGTPVPSPLIRVDEDGSVHAAAEDLWVANGMAITEDGATLLVAESAGRCITAFTIGDTGELTDRRVYAPLPENHAADGMCVDAEGAVWVACVLGGRFARILPGGEIADSVPMEEGRHAIACVLGGPERRTLYLLTATVMGQADAAVAAKAARIEQVDVDVAGAGRP